MEREGQHSIQNCGFDFKIFVFGLTCTDGPYQANCS